MLHIMFTCSFMFQGCGKSIVAKQFAELLGYHLEPIMLYQVSFLYKTCFTVLIVIMVWLFGKTLINT